MTNIFTAARAGDNQRVKELIESGVDVDEVDHEHRFFGWTPLMHACYGHHGFKVVKLLVDHGANVNAKDPDGWTPLTYATETGHADVVVFLVSRGANVNEKNDIGDSPLHMASYYDRLFIVKFLVESGANIDEQNSEGKTPIDIVGFGATRKYLEKVRREKIARRRRQILDARAKIIRCWENYWYHTPVDEFVSRHQRYVFDHVLVDVMR